MPKIAKISVQRKNKERYNIYFEQKGEGEYAFSVDAHTLTQFRLTKGLELSDFDIQDIQYQDGVRRAIHHAISFLSIRMRTEKEVRTYLKQKDYSEEVIQEAITYCLQQKYINERDFAFAFVRTDVATKDWGPGAVRRRLYEKGISLQLTEEALGEYPVETATEKAMAIVEKALASMKKESNIQRKQKCMERLQQKGYDHACIQTALETVDWTQSEEEEADVVQAWVEKLMWKYRQHEGFQRESKVKQALYRKGFSLERIDQALQEWKEENEHGETV